MRVTKSIAAVLTAFILLGGMVSMRSPWREPRSRCWTLN
jgi:hypothetical protein